jgi:agmatinase
LVGVAALKKGVGAVPHYRPSDAQQSPRFGGIRTFARLPHVTDLDGVDVAVVGIPFDTATTYRVGARFGPAAVRDASVLLRPYHPSVDVMVFEELSCVDYGDTSVVPGYIEDAYARITAGIAPILAAGAIPIGIGGDHSITLAELRAVAATHGPVALVQFDSHGDTWDEYFGRKYNHGTPFRRAAEEGLIDPHRSFQAGMRGSLYGPSDYQDAREMGFTLWPMEEVRRQGWEATHAAIRQVVGSGPVFLTYDIDFVDPTYAPGTGTPEVGGPTSWEALLAVRGLVGLEIVAADCVEVLPAFDPTQTTAMLAANVIYEMLALIARNRKDTSRR